MGDTPDSKQYTVSVVIPAYNVEKYIARAIDSVLAQSLLPDEIIVVDDGSTDDTANIVSKYGSKVKLIRQENAGASVARNTGIKAATGEWIAFLDADDEWLPEKLQLQIGLLKRNPHLAWTTANFYRCLCNENRKVPDLPLEKIQTILQDKEYFPDYLKAYTHYARGCTDTILVKRNILQQTGLFMKGLPRFNDLDMWFRIAYQNPQIGYFTQPLAIYHMDISNISQRKYSDDLHLNFLKRHLQLATQHDRLEAFEPCAVFLIRQWTRSMLFDARKEDIRKIINEFTDLLPTSYKFSMQLLTTFPKTTAAACHKISRFVRILKIRKKTVRKPKPEN